jgi:lysine 6-dehydrogenase
LRTLQNKTLRHPGHFNQLRAFFDLGLWSLDPIQVGDVEAVPRDVFHSLFEPQVTRPTDKDTVIVRVKAIGKKEGRDCESRVELIDHFDEETGFTAMERSTGWSAAIVAEMMARGETPRGAAGVETQVPAARFVEELRRRGLEIEESVGSIQ